MSVSICTLKKFFPNKLHGLLSKMLLNHFCKKENKKTVFLLLTFLRPCVLTRMQGRVFDVSFEMQRDSKNCVRLQDDEMSEFEHTIKSAGLKYRSKGTGQVTGPGHRAQGTGHRSQVTGHRSQVTMKNTCKFAGSSYLVGICLFRPFLT